MDEKQVLETLDNMKEVGVYKLTKNLISFNETILN